MATGSEGSRTSRRLRFAVVCRDTRLRAWQIRCLDRLLTSGCAEPVLVISLGLAPASRAKGSVVSRILSVDRSSLIWRLYCHYAKLRSKALAPIDDPDRLRSVDTIRCLARNGEDDLFQYLEKQDLDVIRSYQLDFILQFGGGTLDGEAITAARYGVWRFNHHHDQEVRALAAWFQEIVQVRPTACATLQKLTGSADGAIVLHRATLATEWHLPSNHDRMLLDSDDLCLRVCREILAGGSSALLKQAEREKYSALKMPTNTETVHFLMAQLISWFLDKLMKTFVLDDWAIGVVEQAVEEIRQNGRPSKVAWYSTGRKRTYVADPMPLADADDGSFLAEHFEYGGSAKGCIVRCKSGEDGRLAVIPVLEREHHLSYPFVLDHDGQRYLIPESHELGAIHLYALDHDGGARPLRPLLEGLVANDPTLIRRDGRWWLFCSEGSMKLLAFHADALDGTWTPHRLNPLKIDVTSSRPAGPLFERDGVLYRPAQDCAAAYGAAVVLHRVVELTPERFAEEPVGRIGPELDGPYPEGIHTLHVLGDRCLVDGKRSVFDLTWMVRGRTYGRKVRTRRARLAAGMRDAAEGGSSRAVEERPRHGTAEPALAASSSSRRRP